MLVHQQKTQRLILEFKNQYWFIIIKMMIQLKLINQCCHPSPTFLSFLDLDGPSPYPFEFYRKKCCVNSLIKFLLLCFSQIGLEPHEGEQIMTAFQVTSPFKHKESNSAFNISQKVVCLWKWQTSKCLLKIKTIPCSVRVFWFPFFIYLFFARTLPCSHFKAEKNEVWSMSCLAFPKLTFGS